MTRFVVSISAVLCIVAVAFAEETTEAPKPTEAASTEAPKPTESASTEEPKPETTSEAPKPTEEPKPDTTTSAPDVTTDQADDKYTAACKKQYADKENITAVQISLGPVSTCVYQCATVTQKIRRGIFELDIVEYLGKPVNKDDHSPCAPDMECLSGQCYVGADVDACLDADTSSVKIQGSKKSICKKACVNKEGKQVAEVAGNDGALCQASKKVWKINVPVPGFCQSGECQAIM